MKNLRNLLVAAIAGAALFTGCKKDDSLVPTAAAATTTATKIGIPNNGPGNLHYTISTVISKPGDMVSFRSGSINATSLRLDATMDTGNPLELITREAKVSVTQWALYQHIDLGAINLQQGHYMAFKFSISLQPQNNMYALSLDGNYVANSDPTRVPAKTTANAQRAVHIFVNDPVTISGVYSPSLVITTPDYYTVVFYLSPNELMFGITPEMLDNATTSNDSIYISQDSNPTLYKQILLNLTNNLRVTVVVKDELPTS